MVEKLDMQLLMAAIDERVYDAYDDLTEQEQKAVSPLIVMRWACCFRFNNKQSGQRLIDVNERVNKHLFSFQKHDKKLIWRLLASCGTGSYADHTYIGANKTKDKVVEWLGEIYPAKKQDELVLMRSLMTKDEIKQLAKDYGLDSKQIRELKI